MDYITFPVLMNWVTMLRADVDGAIVLADDDEEGRFYERCISKVARVVPCQIYAREMLAESQARGVKGVVAVVRKCPADGVVEEGVFFPALGDMPSLCIASSCWRGALQGALGGSWLAVAEKEAGDLVERATRLVWTASRLAARRGVGVSPDLVGSLVAWGDFALDDARVVAVFGPDSSDAASALWKAAGEADHASLLRESDGYLVVGLLAQATEKFAPRGLRSARALSTSELIAELRVALPLEVLEEDPLYWRMRFWERRNPRFPLLGEWRALDSLKVVLDQRYWEVDLRVFVEMLEEVKRLCVVKLDLDNFKLVNENLGHARGDEAIKVAARATKETFRGVADVYRRGGDEFVVLAPGLDLQTGMLYGERLRQRIEADFSEWGGSVGLRVCPTASIGVVAVEPGASVAEVVRAMDDAQRQAKVQGKNRVVGASCGTRH